MTNIERATPLFEKGMPTKEVASELGISLASGYVLKSRWKKLNGKTQTAPKPVEVEEEPQDFDLPITVSSEHFDKLFATFSPTEKADAVRAVLQNRVDVILESL